MALAPGVRLGTHGLIGASGALKSGASLQSSAATQIVGKAKKIKAGRYDTQASFVGAIRATGQVV